jgi:hypothetical protein
MTFNGLHAVISQKIWLLITTAVKTTNPKIFTFYRNVGEKLKFIFPRIYSNLMNWVPAINLILHMLKTETALIL